MLFIHFMEFKDTALYSPSSTYPQVCVSGCEIWSSGSGQMGAFYTRLAALVFYVWALSPDFSRLIGERQLAKLCSQPAKKKKKVSAAASRPYSWIRQQQMNCDNKEQDQTEILSDYCWFSTLGESHCHLCWPLFKMNGVALKCCQNYIYV